MSLFWMGVTEKGHNLYIDKKMIMSKEIKDNLDPIEDFFYGISNVKDYHNATHTALSHMIYTHLEWVNGKFFKEVIEILKNAEIESMIDVGGCNGHVSKLLLEFIDTLKQSIIVEPIPKNYHFINFRFCEESRIQICPKAIYYGKDTLTLNSEDGNFGGFHKSNHGYNAPTITLEKFPIPDFLKLDVEGSEYNIIENSTNLKKVPFINIEFHDSEDKSCSEWEDYVSTHFPEHKIGLNGKDFMRFDHLSYHEQVLLVPKKYKIT